MPAARPAPVLLARKLDTAAAVSVPEGWTFSHKKDQASNESGP